MEEEGGGRRTPAVPASQGEPPSRLIPAGHFVEANTRARHRGRPV